MEKTLELCATFLKNLSQIHARYKFLETSFPYVKIKDIE